MTLKYIDSNHSYWLDGKRTTGVTHPDNKCPICREEPCHD